MKRLLLLAPLLIFSATPEVSAHSGPPFISVNDVANLSNQAGSGSVFFKVPNEIAATTFVVNQTLSFKIDTTLLPVNPDQVNPSDFLWEFANGKTGTGLTPSTSYTKSGSYIVILKVKDPSYTEPIELESMQINILPNRNSELPTAVITVNGKTIVDPFKEPFFIDKNSEVELSAGESKGKIRSYKWDLGDGSKLSEGENIKHKFDFSQPYAYSFFPVLRVEDENGLYSDAVVQIASADDENSSTESSKTNGNSNTVIFIILGLGGISLIVGILLMVWKRAKG
jgi:hypothetical protein